MWHGEVAAEAGQEVPHSRVVDENREGYLGEPAIPAPGQTAQPRVSALGRESLVTSGSKIKWGLGQWKKLPVS